MKKAITLLFLLACAGATFAQQGVDSAITRLQAFIPAFMQQSNIPGAAIAVIRNGKLVWQQGFGVANADTKLPVTNQTVFECNSLSKPVFAYGVMLLVQGGKLNLDTPLERYMDTRWHPGKDARMARVTARMLLAHMGGLKYISQNEVGFNFNPGESWQYSPVGYDILTKVVEHITGMPVETYMYNAVLKPLGMAGSSFVWQPQYDSLRVYQHNWQGHVAGGLYKWPHGAGCCSMQTTTADYSRFVIAFMQNTLGMAVPQINANSKFPSVAWGLGWGLEKQGDTMNIWHWGDGGNSKDYIVANLTTKDAVIFFANSQNGLFFIKEVLAAALGRNYQSTEFLGYQRYDSPSWVSLQTIAAKGAKAFLHKFKKGDLDEEQVNTIGYRLMEAGKLEDAKAMLLKNTVDYPASWNTWDSLAEACAKAGDNKAATGYYKKSLELNPDNKGAADWLKAHL